MVIDFCTTATIRPDILYQTYYSFNQNLINLNLKECNLYLNIDPIPFDEQKRNELIKIANNFFGQVVVHFAKKPSFPLAVKWCWSSTKLSFVFHLEDDWVLKESIDFSELMEKFNKTRIQQIVLRAYMNTAQGKMPLSPSIIRGVLCRQIGKLLSGDQNPETQLRSRPIQSLFGGNKITVPNHPVVKDIGRTWFGQSGMKRNKQKEKFIRWISQ